MTVLEAIQKSSEFLDKKEIESPRLQSELLLSHLLQIKRLNLYLEFARKLTDDQVTRYRELIKRRGAHEPLQHIIGTAVFCGLEVKVNRAVLIPRPETELLAEQGWLFLNSIAETDDRDVSFLDLATGSGCIALAMLKHSPRATAHASDFSADALATARENAASLKLDSRIHFHQSDGFAGLPSELKVDLIISNPPYIPSDEIPTLQPEVRDFDPHLALDGGPDGLRFYRMLATEAARFLTPGGRLLIEFGDGQEQAISDLLAERNWTVQSILPDYAGKPRMISARPIAP